MKVIDINILNEEMFEKVNAVAMGWNKRLDLWNGAGAGNLTSMLAEIVEGIKHKMWDEIRIKWRLHPGDPRIIVALRESIREGVFTTPDGFEDGDDEWREE